LFVLGVQVCPGVSAESVDPSIKAARKILAEHQDSVLWITAVCKIRFSAEGGSDQPMNIPEQERKVEAVGTVLGTNGLMVAALSAIDLSQEVTGREIPTAKGRVRLEASATLKDVLIIMPDGTELPAEVIMKDVDLDLVFLMAKNDSEEFKRASFKPVDLKHPAKVMIADEVVSLGRADEVLSRQPSVYSGQVNVLVKKPREFIRVSSASLGAPTFDLDGNVVGIGVVRRMTDRRSVAVLIPAADVDEIAEQAIAAVAKSAKATK
jgi:S1-C subfamily serine protease